jgi:hypothetical protein
MKSCVDNEAMELARSNKAPGAKIKKAAIPYFKRNKVNPKGKMGPSLANIGSRANITKSSIDRTNGLGHNRRAAAD